MNFEERAQDYRLFHQSICNGDLENVKSFIEKYQSQKIVFNAYGESALKIALKSVQLEVYEVLIANGFKLGKSEKFDKIINKVLGNDDEGFLIKEKLRKIHVKYVKNSTLNHLIELNVKSKLTHTSDDQSRRSHHERIVKTYEELNEIKWINPILKIVSMIESLRIVFDFHRDSVNYMDPTKNQETKGAMYPFSAIVFIGAIFLLHDQKRFSVYAVLAHELTHIAMLLVYDNECKPYRAHDKERRAKFKQIIQASRRHKKAEQIISTVFDCYPEKMWDVELIVCVPQILASYKEYPEKLRYCQTNFNELFEFYEKKILPELYAKIAELEAQQEEIAIEEAVSFMEQFAVYEAKKKAQIKTRTTLIIISIVFLVTICITFVLFATTNENPLMKEIKEIHELNAESGIISTIESSKIWFTNQSLESLHFNFNESEKILYITTNCVKLTTVAIYQKLKENNMLESKVFMSWLKMQSQNIFNRTEQVMKSAVPVLFLVQFENSKNELFSEMISKLERQNVTQNIIIVRSYRSKSDPSFYNFTQNRFNHFWSQLTSESQQIMLKKFINFQGFEIQLKDLLKNNSNIFGHEKFVEFVMSSEKPEIGKRIELEDIHFYIDRHFLMLNAKWNNTKRNFEPEPMKISEIINRTEENKMFLLSDEPGNGKSTEFQMAAQKLKQKFPSRWVVLIDLKLYTSVYREKVTVNFGSADEIAKFLAFKILKLGDFESVIFVELFISNRIIILMDGVDEISPTFKEFVENLMGGIREESENQLWVTTRPHLVNELEVFLRTKSFKLLPFTIENRRKFVMGFLKRRKNYNQKSSEEIEKFFEIIEKISFQNDSVSNLVVIQMTVELLEDDLYFKIDKNLFTIYDEYVKKMFVKLAQKGSEAENDLVMFVRNIAINKFHQQKAFEITKEFKNATINKFFSSMPELSVEQLVRIGLMFDDGTGNIHFVHRTFADFFIAGFIYEKTLNQIEQSDKASKRVADLWLEALQLVDNGKGIRKFMDERAKIEENKHFEISIKTIKFFQQNFENHQKLFSNSINEGCLNLIEFVSQNLIKN